MGEGGREGEESLPSLNDDKKRLNNCLLLHVHKTLSDNLDLTAVAKEFISQHDKRLKYF